MPPRKTRCDPWEYDRELDKRRNEVERLFPRLKGFRRSFSRFEKLDVIFLGFIVFTLIFDALRSCEHVPACVEPVSGSNGGTTKESHSAQGNLKLRYYPLCW